MTHTTRVGTELVSLGDSGFVCANPEDDLSAAGVSTTRKASGWATWRNCTSTGRSERFAFWRSAPAASWESAEGAFVLPVEAVTRVAEDRVTIEPDRTEKAGEPAPFDTRVAPSTTTTPRFPTTTNILSGGPKERRSSNWLYSLGGPTTREPRSATRQAGRR